MAHYGADTDASDPGSDAYAADAVMEACILANEQYPELNFADYDSDKDGYVDFVFLIYAGEEQASTGVTDQIWPHNWTLSSAYSWGNCTYSSNNRKLDGKTIDNYACAGEIAENWDTGEIELCGIGTLCHEFSHVMGLPDLYDTQSDSNTKTPYQWSLMDGGCYNGEGHCVPNYDPWQKYFFGWNTPINIGTDPQNIVLKPNGTEGYVAYQVNSSNKLQTPTTSGEVYYLENRQLIGWDSFLPGPGMLVWKIKFNSSAWSGNRPNNTSTSGYPLHSVVPADGGSKVGTFRDSNGKITRNGNRDPFPGATNKRSYTPITGHELTEIQVIGGNVTFKYNGGLPTYEYEVDATHCTVSAASGSGLIGETLRLIITPETGYLLDNPDCWLVEMGVGNDLVYGEGFTYDAATNEFVIENVTSDVTILVEAMPIPVNHNVTWHYCGGEYVQTYTEGDSLTLPTEIPEDNDGKPFYGWIATEHYTGAEAPDLISAGSAVNADADYYAVYK